MSTHIVAVYGTLREGLSDHGLIANCKRIGLGWLTGFRMHNLGDFPAIVPTLDESGRIRVEWYQVGDELLAELDQLQGLDETTLSHSIHTRKRIFTPYGKGWIYIYNQTLGNAPYMEAGDWTRFLKEQSNPTPLPA
ncbi:gamma-glutamylcyclotransferase family protein [Marinomonas posidonica]|uniref:AIG2 family protein n=1 Tax=Marinomonas posidonica (strain CECT 7376 / NCIMB 14433 / IVIA-Po-181) TaxID=491952 RepID=F6CVW0_MARPP|nr:gamma-glutamylcyclotransferase family protein [Marinomonas posidonica]AEF53168.1 AIG2 family protein [Marinomonas posidonica IVIA-Po-181]